VLVVRGALIGILNRTDDYYAEMRLSPMELLLLVE